ncbi:hypothetical protein [Bombiscardovia apis]|uniref:hypothetical protein n=1 Tax=Bombiscardovia apis TaxID=2932182 RepID=UPI002953D6B5|nr:hypothetical protein [Bombiscardovia apis]
MGLGSGVGADCLGWEVPRGVCDSDCSWGVGASNVGESIDFVTVSSGDTSLVLGDCAALRESESESEDWD